MPRKIIIDTDPGIDDALAIFFALNAPQLDVIALTTVFGNVPVELATKNALSLVEMTNFTVPVASGVKAPLFIPPLPHPEAVHGSDGFGNINLAEPKNKADNRSAAEMIIDLVRAHPNQVSIITLGPLGNLAEVLALDPTITVLVDEVIIMGGAAATSGNMSPVAEANIIQDPYAADRVFSADWKVTMVGLDVTKKVIMNRELLEKIKEGNQQCGEFLYQITQFYFDFHKKAQNMDGCYVHDASTIAYAIAPDIFTCEQGAVRVATEGVAIGQTVIAEPNEIYHLDYWDSTPKSTICLDVDSERLLSLLEKTLTEPKA
jgi:inosine-uridine nucleoside N-ribohydrolase